MFSFQERGQKSRIDHICQFVNFCHVFVTIHRLLWQVWQKGSHWVKLACLTWCQASELCLFSRSHLSGFCQFSPIQQYNSPWIPHIIPKNTRQLSHLPWPSDFIDIVHYIFKSQVPFIWISRGQQISSTRPKLSQDRLSTRILAALPRQINCF